MGIVYGAGNDTPAQSSSICICLFILSMDIPICCQLSISIFLYVYLFISILNNKRSGPTVGNLPESSYLYGIIKKIRI